MAVSLPTRLQLLTRQVSHGTTDTKDFVDLYLHCIVSRTGKKIPRPLATALNGSRPNEVLHVDFLYMGPCQEGLKYILLLRNDFSSYVWCFALESADAESAAGALTSWFAAFSSMPWLVTDQGAHFKNQILVELKKTSRYNHHFTTPYSPWANGTVERVCREFLRACKALLS